MKYLLVLQGPASSEADFNELVEMEDELELFLDENASADGHDFGSGEMNIFIETDQPERTFDEAGTILSTRSRWTDVRAAHREQLGESYTVLWPSGQTEFEIK